MIRIEGLETALMMRRSIPLLCGCLTLGWAFPVVAGEGPSAPPSPTVSVEPAPSQPEIGQLPRYDDPLTAANNLPPFEPPRDPSVKGLIAAGSTVLGLGVVLEVLGASTWYQNRSYFAPEPSLIPWVEMGIGLVFIAIGSSFLSVGVKRHKRWEASLTSGSARLQLQPVVGFGQIGVVGRF